MYQRIAIVTGVSRLKGIGRAICLALAKKGDEEQSDFTLWGCYRCGYEAEEDETAEKNCTKCGNKTESRLKDELKDYWWCSTCNSMAF